MTILFLLAFSALPAAAQVYQVTEAVSEFIAQVGDGEETMECCKMAGQCKMKGMMPEAGGEECLTPCECAARAPLLPVGLLSNAPPLPQADEPLLLPSPLTNWAEAPATNSLLHFWPPPKISLTNFRYTCLRI